MGEFLDPTKVLNQLELRETMSAADFGCGSGGWAIPLAKILKDGKVYAVDLLEEPLSALRSRMATEKVLNIVAVRANIEKEGGSKITAGTMDLVLLTNLLFQCDDKKTVLGEARNVLKPGGTILVVDWQQGAPLGPKGREVSVEEIKEIAEKIGLRFEKEFTAGTYHFGLVFKK